jgi:MinD-like ATPase involved in chromosome partitioning or flagellar assembly
VTSFAVAVPFEDEQRLVSEAARYGHSIVMRCSGADELAGRLTTASADVALVLATPQYLNPRLIDACDAAGIGLLVLAPHAEQLRHARALGIVDALAGEVSWQTVAGGPVAGPVADGASDYARADAIRELEPGPVKAVSSARRRGSVIAVWGAAGAPGRTSLAISIAAELAEAGASVALGDADTHAASIDPLLGLLDEAPGFAAACRLAGSGALTVSEFERVAEWKRSGRSGFPVLTGLGRPSRWPELTSDRVAGAITAARDWVDVLVLDTASSLEQDEELSSDLVAPRRNAATIASLRAADHVIAVAAADPVGLARYLRGHAELLETANPARLTTVVNKVRSSAIGINPSAQIAQTLARFGGISDPVLVPWDPTAFDAAMLSGRPLLDAAPRSSARTAIRKLVHERILVPASLGRRRR